MIKRIYHWFIVNWFLLACKLQTRKLASLIHRLSETEFKNIKISNFRDFQSMADFMKPGYYRNDIGDFVSYPGKAESVFLGLTNPKSNFDCDDYAIWCHASLIESKKAFQQNPKNGIPNLGKINSMGIYWAESGMTIRGHAVCLFEILGKGWFYMDYYMPTGPFLTPQEAARHIVHNYHNSIGIPLMYEISDINLKIQEYGVL
jgi:hypothetical protein